MTLESEKTISESEKTTFESEKTTLESEKTKHVSQESWAEYKIECAREKVHERESGRENCKENE